MTPLIALLGSILLSLPANALAQNEAPGLSSNLAMLPKVDLLPRPAERNSSQQEPARFERWLRANGTAVHACADCRSGAGADILR